MSENKKNNSTVVVGMSGGVDSSVAALLLKQQGYRVIGMFMKNWEEKDADGVCQSSKEYEDVIRVCEHIGIPYYSVNFVQEYQDTVFKHFLEEFKQGHTPNPDILCNREIKFKVLLEKAKELGADFLATGHYCRIGKENGRYQLLKGLDPNKDQSYFLYTIKEEILKDVLFPIGHFPKAKVREIAREHGIPTAEKKDSTGICFIGKRNFKQFLNQYIQYQQGNFETPDGEVVGRHDGVAFYTIGQRRGTGIGGPGDPWYVVGKDISRNVVVVAQGSEHPALFREGLEAVELSWVGDAPETPCEVMSKVRYRQKDQACVIEEIQDGRAVVWFKEPQRAVTPRQSVVFYGKGSCSSDGDVCLGGGVIV